MILDTPDNSVCPPESQLETTRANISSNVSEILTEFVENNTDTYTIPECGGSGWSRVAYLDMTDPEQNCPEQWRLYESNNVRACGRQESDVGSCDSVYYSSGATPYTQVCGRITGYLYDTSDGIARGWGEPHSPGNEINGPYLDGVSVTYGTPRQHIWSFFCGHVEYQCCSEEDWEVVESYNIVGDNYFCDIGSFGANILAISSPVWDGNTQCSSDPNCCAPDSGPWFNTTLPSPSTSDIEVRVCADQYTEDEDSPVELIDIYVK